MACISVKMLMKVVLGVVIVGIVTETAECLNVISRSEWGARPAKWAAKSLRTTPTNVIVHHSETPTCTSRVACTNRMKSIQNYHINNKKWSDIGYNFVVAEDGNVYEGRGWGKQGAHAQEVYNPKSIGICVIGKYATATPNVAALTALEDLIAHGVSIGKIGSNYKLLGHRQVVDTDCPGNSLYNVIQTWPNYASSP